MIITQHYLYYMDEDGYGMILIRHEPQPNGQIISEWISHSFITDYNPPLLFSPKEAKDLLDHEEWAHIEVQIGDWVSIRRCRENLHQMEGGKRLF